MYILPLSCVSIFGSSVWWNIDKVNWPNNEESMFKWEITDYTLLPIPGRFMQRKRSIVLSIRNSHLLWFLCDILLSQQNAWSEVKTGYTMRGHDSRVSLVERGRKLVVQKRSRTKHGVVVSTLEVFLTLVWG